MNKVIAVLIGGFGGIGCCILAVLGTAWYAETPWPSPQPYPSVDAHAKVEGGSEGPSRIQVYTVTLSLDDMQRYYEKQMSQYCEDNWQFEASPSCDRYFACRSASCQVRRFWMRQHFRVDLYSVSPTQTMVTHADSWQD